MILTGTTIKTAITENTWQCNISVDKLHFNPNSVDCTLSPYIYTTLPNSEILDPIRSNPEEYFDLQHIEEYVLNPSQFILASVNEVFTTNNPINGKFFTQIFDGRSTVARMGILTHVSAGYGDYGFSGAFTLEVVNHSPFPIRLHAGMRIGQIYFCEIDSNAQDLVYKGYNHSKGIPGLPKLGYSRFY